MIRVRIVLAAALAWAAAHSAWADFDAGQAAFDAGRFDEAVAEWRAAADAGDARAMLALGRLHVRGVGAPQDYVAAHAWLNLAAGRGEAAAAAERDALAERMTAEQVAAAQDRAARWRPGESVAGAAAAPPAPAASDAGPPPPRAIREAQALLAALGYAPGPADGVWGARTGAAYAAFLRDSGLAAAETLTPESLRALRAAAPRDAAAPPPAPAPAPAPPPPPAAPPRDAAALAVRAGDVDGLAAALAAGADVDARDGGGWTALMHAANEGFVLMVPPLLEAGAELDVRAADGATALFIAIVRGHAEVAALLVRAGADASFAGPQGRTAVDAARAKWGGMDEDRLARQDPALRALLDGMTWAEAEKVAELNARAGETFRDCPHCPEMVVVPSGRFMMGSPPSEKDRDDDEGPVHRVAFAAPFAVGVHEVTFAEWDACVSAGGCGGYSPNDQGWGRGSRPVVTVSWDDAQSYVGWLSRSTGEDYRLLSESEWEYVARAGTSTRYWWGNDIGRNRANCDGCGSRWDREGTAPVGSFAANVFGLHDVHGNVWEWTGDCWNESYAGAPGDGSAWEDGSCSHRVLRGGSWDFNPRRLRSAFRIRVVTGYRSGNVGFRVARTFTP